MLQVLPFVGNSLCPVNNRSSRLSRQWIRMTLPTDSGFPSLCRASYPLIPTSPWKTMKVIKAIDMFVCIFYEYCTLPSGQCSILAAHIPRSNKPPCLPRSDKSLFVRQISEGSAHMKVGVIKLCRVCVLCCQMDFPLSFCLPCALFLAGVAVGITIATGSVSGEYLVLAWCAITGHLKALSTKIPQLLSERKSSQHSRWVPEPERGMWMEREGRREGGREEGSRKDIKKRKKINVIVGCVALGSNKASVRHISPEGWSLITHLLSVNRSLLFFTSHICGIKQW